MFRISVLFIVWLPPTTAAFGDKGRAPQSSISKDIPVLDGQKTVHLRGGQKTGAPTVHWNEKEIDEVKVELKKARKANKVGFWPWLVGKGSQLDVDEGHDSLSLCLQPTQFHAAVSEHVEQFHDAVSDHAAVPCNCTACVTGEMFELKLNVAFDLWKGKGEEDLQDALSIIIKDIVEYAQLFEGMTANNQKERMLWATEEWGDIERYLEKDIELWVSQLRLQLLIVIFGRKESAPVHMTPALVEFFKTDMLPHMLSTYDRLILVGSKNLTLTKFARHAMINLGKTFLNIATSLAVKVGDEA